MSLADTVIRVLRQHGFTHTNDQENNAVTLYSRSGVFTVRVRVPLSRHAPRLAMWFGFVTPHGIVEQLSEFKARNMMELAYEAIALTRTLRSTL